MPEKRKISETEQQQVQENLRRSMDEFFQWTQIKMALRVLKTEENSGIDKEKLKYVDIALDNIFNRMLQEVIPKVEKRKKTFLELGENDFDAALKTDPLLTQFRQTEYIYHISTPNTEEKEHPVSDLVFLALNSNRFTLTGTIGGLDWAIIDSNPVTTIMVPDPAIPEQSESVAHGVYRIWCFQCKEFFVYETNEGVSIEQISCDKCKSVILEREKRKHESD